MLTRVLRGFGLGLVLAVVLAADAPGDPPLPLAPGLVPSVTHRR